MATQRGTKKGSEAVIVRVIEYRLTDPGVADDKGEIYRLITTILDPSVATAAELAALYPQRWEIEITNQGGKNNPSKRPDHAAGAVGGGC